MLDPRDHQQIRAYLKREEALEAEHLREVRDRMRAIVREHAPRWGRAIGKGVTSARTLVEYLINGCAFLSIDPAVDVDEYEALYDAISQVVVLPDDEGLTISGVRMDRVWTVDVIAPAWRGGGTGRGRSKVLQTATARACADLTINRAKAL